jgi:hypothetical protein
VNATSKPSTRRKRLWTRRGRACESRSRAARRNRNNRKEVEVRGSRLGRR